MEFVELKDILYLGFLAVALYFSNRQSWIAGVREGVEAAIDGMVRDGYIDYDPETEEISAKKS